jgi:DNA-binding response OmpR family regulator
MDTIAAVLLISLCEEDHRTLRRMLDDREFPVHWVQDREQVPDKLRHHRVGVVIAERDLPGGTWKDVLGQLASLPTPPLLIVTSPQADNFLWAEVLNLGGWDVLAKPFYRAEMSRVVQLAGARWQMRRLGVQ